MEITAMMSTKIPLTVFMFLLSLTPATGQSQPESDTLTAEQWEKLWMYERSFKPSSYDGDMFLFKKTDTAKVLPSTIGSTVSAPPETLQGFRVQLFASNIYDEVSQMRNTLSLLYPELWTYMVYEAPSYKLRIGDFTNRTDARALANELSSKGFRNGWVVPDKIIKNQQSKPPAPIPIDTTTVDGF